MKLGNFTAVIFDAEGVIVDTEPLWDESQRILLEARGLQYDRAGVKHLMAGRSLRDGTAALREYYNLTETVDDLAAARLVIIRDLFAERVELMAGFAEFYEAVRSYNLKLAVATSMRNDLLDVVDARLQLRPRFGGHVYTVTDAGGAGKPAPDVFLFAAQNIDAAATECLVIEDTPAGIAAAKAAGMFCAGLTTTFEADMLRDADVVYDSFTAFTEELT